MVVDDPTVSRQHARFVVTPAQIRIFDLESKNGTFVNGAAVTNSCVIHPGDLLCFGKVIAVVTANAAGRTAASALTASATPDEEWTRVERRTRSFDSVAIRGMLRERNEVLHHLLDALGGLGAIIRHDVRSVADLDPYLRKIAELLGASRALAVEFNATGDCWRMISQSHERDSLSPSDQLTQEQLISQAYSRQEIAFVNAAIPSGDGSPAADLMAAVSLAIPLTAEGERIGVLYLDQPRVGHTDWKSQLEFGQLGADILALKLLNMRQHDAELKAAMTDALLRESEAGREALAKAYQLLHDQQEELLQANKLAALGRLAAGIVHEINTPLAVVRSSGQTIVAAISHSSNPAQTEACLQTIRCSVEHVLTGSHRIGEVISALRSFALLDRPRILPLDVNESLDATIRLLGSRFPETIEVVRDYGKLAPLICPGRELNQVLLVVLENAFQAVTDTGKITIKTDCNGANVIVEITDNGCGIAEERLSRIFDPDFAVREGKVRLGLGLSMAKRVLLEMNGQIAIRSVVAKGTAVRIQLPVTMSQ